MFLGNDPSGRLWGTDPYPTILKFQLTIIDLYVLHVQKMGGGKLQIMLKKQFQI